MVAYSFKANFAEPIIAGKKYQTVRLDRKRHARPGEHMQLYVGMRTKHCRKIINPDPVCVSVETIKIVLDERQIYGIEIGDGLLLGSDAMEMFARRDGFEDLGAMHKFWQENHPGTLQFNGVVVTWKDQR